MIDSITRIRTGSQEMPYEFKPLPLVRRVGPRYVPVEGDGRALLLLTVAIGVLSVSMGILQQQTTDGTFATVVTDTGQSFDAIRRVLVYLLRG
jgi:hypothetical protein